MILARWGSEESNKLFNELVGQRLQSPPPDIIERFGYREGNLAFLWIGIPALADAVVVKLGEKLHCQPFDLIWSSEETGSEKS